MLYKPKTPLNKPKLRTYLLWVEKRGNSHFSVLNSTVSQFVTLLT